jgi:hypothetical protein
MSELFFDVKNEDPLKRWENRILQDIGTDFQKVWII